MSDLPERAGPPPDAIDVAGVERPPGAAPAVPIPVASAAAPPDDAARPERRHLDTPELIEEGTKLVVGSVLLVGRGLRALIETYAPPRHGEPRQDAPPATQATTAPSTAPTSAAATSAAPPDTVLAALPVALLGAGLQAQRRLVSAVVDAQERLGPAVSWWLDRPLLSPAYQRLRSQVFAWYEQGRADADASRAQALAVMGGGADEGLGFVYENLDLNVITSGFDVSPLIQNLELNDIILQSTGGLATEAIDAVRAQGVMVDDVLERVTSKLFRRRAQRVPKGPPGRYGPAERFPDREPS